MTAKPTSPETTMPTPTCSIDTVGLGFAIKPKAYSPAPRLIGAASKKLNRAASSRLSPRHNPAVMVMPERDVPGIKASA